MTEQQYKRLQELNNMEMDGLPLGPAAKREQRELDDLATEEFFNEAREQMA